MNIILGLLKWKFAGKIIRKLLMLLAGWMVSQGWIEADQTSQIVGLVTGIVSLLWSGKVEVGALAAIMPPDKRRQ